MHGELVIRRATASDYPAFCRLFPELETNDPVPAEALWESAYVPSTWVAVRGEAVVGYCFFLEYRDSGYVRNVVVSPSARGQGVGMALMTATAEHLKQHGKTSWCLNVKPDNLPALRLYGRLGMQPRHAVTALRLPWSALTSIPAGRGSVREIAIAQEAELERVFSLPHGQLAEARRPGHFLLEARSADGDRPIGLSVFDPAFPGAFPFRVNDLAAVRPLLVAMRARARKHDDDVAVVAENDDALSELLRRAGANVRGEFLHLSAPL